MVLQKDATIQQLQEQKDRLEFAFEVGAWAGRCCCQALLCSHPPPAGILLWHLLQGSSRVLRWDAGYGGLTK
jgi:hypothetical protein